MNHNQSAKEPSVSSLMSITSNKCTIKIPIKLGSNQIYVSISKDTKCSHVIRQALLQCNIKTNFKTVLIGDGVTRSQRHLTSRDNYALFERAAGIEQMIKSDQNIFELWLQWKLRRTDLKVEFVIKKCTTSKKITRPKKINTHKLFEIGRQKGVVKSNVVKIENNKLSYEIQTHLYEKIDSDIENDSLNESKSTDQQVNEEATKDMSNKIKFNSSILKHVKNVKRIIKHLNGKQSF